MDFLALFLVISAIYLYGIRPHFYIYTFKSKGSRSYNSYFALFPHFIFFGKCNLLLLQQHQQQHELGWRKISLGQSQFVGRLTFWGTVMLELKKNTKKMLNILLFLCRPFHFPFLQAFVPRWVFTSQFLSYLHFKGEM